MEQSPSWEADSQSASHETPRLLRSLQVHYRVHKSLVIGHYSEPNESNPQLRALRRPIYA
jgi:hypothetical protein